MRRIDSIETITTVIVVLLLAVMLLGSLNESSDNPPYVCPVEANDD
jgi:hypothetical protein